MFFKTVDYELLKPLKELKPLLTDIAAGVDTVNGSLNQYQGKVGDDGMLAILKRKFHLTLIKYKVELRESEEGIVWLRMKMGPSIMATGMFLLLITISALIDLTILKSLLPITLAVLYIYFLLHANDSKRVGVMLDPSYFKSPEAKSKVSSNIWSVAMKFTIPLYILSFLAIIYHLLRNYFDVF